MLGLQAVRRRQRRLHNTARDVQHRRRYLPDGGPESAGRRGNAGDTGREDIQSDGQEPGRQTYARRIQGGQQERPKDSPSTQPGAGRGLVAELGDSQTVDKTCSCELLCAAVY